jgi:hypothetical protein
MEPMFCILLFVQLGSQNWNLGTFGLWVSQQGTCVLTSVGSLSEWIKLNEKMGWKQFSNLKQSLFVYQYRETMGLCVYCVCALLEPAYFTIALNICLLFSSQTTQRTVCHFIKMRKRPYKMYEKTGEASRGLPLQKPNTHPALLAFEQGRGVRSSQPTLTLKVRGERPYEELLEGHSTRGSERLGELPQKHKRSCASRAPKQQGWLGN